MRTIFALWLFLGLSVTSCSDDAAKRPIGAACSSDSRCESGICGGGVCLDPEVDTDGDGLVNRVEAALKTNPVLADSDGDGKSDFEETNQGSLQAPKDTDGDGRIDAIESLYADSDGDCIPDERDPLDGKFETDLVVIADLSCCCDGRCSTLGENNVTATCVETTLDGGAVGGCRSNDDCTGGGVCDLPSGRCSAATDAGEFADASAQSSGGADAGVADASPPPSGGSAGPVQVTPGRTLTCSGRPAVGALYPSCTGTSDGTSTCGTACEIGYARCGDDPAEIERCAPIPDTAGCYAMQLETCPGGTHCVATDRGADCLNQ